MSERVIKWLIDDDGLIDDPTFIEAAIKFARDWYADHSMMMRRAGISLVPFDDLLIEQKMRFGDLAGERMLQQRRMTYCPHIIEIAP